MWILFLGFAILSQNLLFTIFWRIHVICAHSRHQIVGLVTEVGNKVEKFKVGDRVGVGCMVGSCRCCTKCLVNQEFYCQKVILTCTGTEYDGTPAYGGYSNFMVADEHFVLRIPDSLSLELAAPLLCAGTAYGHLKYYGRTIPGANVGVVGLGSLARVVVKFAKAFGLKVTLISTSVVRESLEHIGADSFLLSSDLLQMQAQMGTMDNIIDTMSASHPGEPLMRLLKADGELVVLGVPDKLEVSSFSKMVGRRVVARRCMVGMKETQEMLDFAAEHKLTMEEVMVLDPAMFNLVKKTAWDNLAEKADNPLSFVLDVAKWTAP